MPIYAYRCQACGFAKDVLQKISDDTLSVCPSCNEDSFRKQLTAAGFQLKGSGWYVTDFRNGNAAAPPAAKSDAPDAPATADTATTPTAPASATTATTASTTPAPAATSSGTS